MIKITNAEALLAIEQEINEKIHEYNNAITEKAAFDVTTKIENDLKDLEGQYAEEKRSRIFEAAAQTENPILEAVGLLEYSVIGHKLEKESGIVTGIEKVEKVNSIDFVKLCQYCNLPITWYHMIEKFNQLMTMRAAKDLGYSDEQILKVCDSFFMSRLANQCEDFQKAAETEKRRKKNPVSNATICAELQKVLDEFLMVDDGNGKNQLHVSGKDVQYLLLTYTKRGKRAGIVAMPKSQTMAKLFADICHQIVTNRGYVIDFKKAKGAEGTAEVLETETKPVEPETVEVPETEAVQETVEA